MSSFDTLEESVEDYPGVAQFKTGVGDTMGGTPIFKRRSYGSSCGSSIPSPDTEEFESLEKSFREELEQKLHERKSSDSERKISDISNRERKVSELSVKLSDMSSEDQLSLQLVEKRQLRSFSRADEYLYAMKEDLAEWLNMLYPNINIDAENFMDTLQTGEHLLRVRPSNYQHIQQVNWLKVKFSNFLSRQLRGN